MPSYKELSKKSDEHKALLAQKCVDLIMRKIGPSSEETSEVDKGCNAIIIVFINIPVVGKVVCIKM